MIKKAIQKNKILKEEYEGWTNHDTWAVSLYLNNERPLYDLLSKERGKLTVDRLKSIFMLLPRYNREGYKEIKPRNVNWQEIVDDENTKN